MATRLPLMFSCCPAGSHTGNGPHCPPDSVHKGLHAIRGMASPTHPNHPRPYGIPGWLLRLIPIGRHYWHPYLLAYVIIASITSGLKPEARVWTPPQFSVPLEARCFSFFVRPIRGD